MKKFWLFIFFLAASGQLVAQFLPEGWLHWITKPLLMIALGIYYYTSQSRVSIPVVLAIFFSFLGDISLMFQVQNGMFFIVGLVSFLAAHIFYLLSYRQHRFEAYQYEAHNYAPLNNVQKIRFSFPIMLLGTGLVTVLYPGLGDLRFPVMVYAGVLVCMVLLAMYRYGCTNSRSFWLVFGGACFFMVSDSLLAINKFYSPIEGSGFWIMATYILAQFMIVQGLIVHKGEHKM